MGLSTTQKGILYAFVGFNSFTLADTCMKWLGEYYEPYIISFWAYGIVLVLSVVFSLHSGFKKNLKTRGPFIHIARGMCMTFVSVLSVTAFAKGVSLPTFYTIMFLIPMLVTMAAIPIYKEHVSRQGWAVILLGFAGISVAFVKDASFLTPPIIYALLTLFFGVVVGLLARPIDKRDHVLTIPFYTALVIVFSLFAYMGGQPPLPSSEHFLVFLLCGFLLFMGVTGVFQGFRIGRYASVAPVQYVQMLSGIVVGYYFFNDVPNGWMLVGAGMIIASGLLLIVQNKKEA